MSTSKGRKAFAAKPFTHSSQRCDAQTTCPRLTWICAILSLHGGQSSICALSDCVKGCAKVVNLTWAVCLNPCTEVWNRLRTAFSGRLLAVHTLDDAMRPPMPGYRRRSCSRAEWYLFDEHTVSCTHGMLLQMLVEGLDLKASEAGVRLRSQAAT